MVCLMSLPLMENCWWYARCPLSRWKKTDGCPMEPWWWFCPMGNVSTLWSLCTDVLPSFFLLQAQICPVIIYTSGGWPWSHTTWKMGILRSIYLVFQDFHSQAGWAIFFSHQEVKNFEGGWKGSYTVSRKRAFYRCMFSYIITQGRPFGRFS